MSPRRTARGSRRSPTAGGLVAGAVVAALAATALTLAPAGCSVKNPDFCCSTLDSCGQVGVGAITTCADPARPFCDDEGAYGPARACAPDPGTTACSGPADCPAADRPRCDVDDTGTCIGCAAAEDCTRFATTPLCDEGSGACVACRTSADCGGSTPVCGADATCRPCDADGECASGLCALGGTCPAADAIVFVDAAAPAGNLACTQQAPCPTMATGIAAVTAVRRHVKVAPGAYTGQVLVDGKSAAIAGRGAMLRSGSGTQVFELRNGADVTLIGLRVHDSVGRGVLCTDATVALREVTIENNVLRGLEAISCAVTIERSRILTNRAGGVLVQNGSATVRNSFIASNGGPTGPIGPAGLDVISASPVVIEFNTIADNVPRSGSSGPAGLRCVSPIQARVSSNIVVGDAANQIDAADCGPIYTLSNETVAGTGNLTGRPTFRDPATSDYHLLGVSAAVDAAEPGAALADDIDGETRPANGRSDIGADELH